MSILSSLSTMVLLFHKHKGDNKNTAALKRESNDYMITKTSLHIKLANFSNCDSKSSKNWQLTSRNNINKEIRYRFYKT